MEARNLKVGDRVRLTGSGNMQPTIRWFEESIVLEVVHINLKTCDLLEVNANLRFNNIPLTGVEPESMVEARLYRLVATLMEEHGNAWYAHLQWESMAGWVRCTSPTQVWQIVKDHGPSRLKQWVAECQMWAGGKMFSFPAPMCQPPKIGTPYAIPHLKNGLAEATVQEWRDTPIDRQRLVSGICHLDFVNAQTQAGCWLACNVVEK